MPNPLTPAERQVLAAELDQLYTTGRRQLAARIAALRSAYGHQFKDGTYDQIRADQQQLEARIRELRFLLDIEDPSPLG